jgi:phosphoserine phosphatase RsbU/P
MKRDHGIMKRIKMENMENRKLTPDHLSLLYRLSQTFNSSLNLDEVLNHVMDEVIAVLRAERGFIMLRDDRGELLFRTARGIDQNTIQEPDFKISRSVVEQVARSGQSVLTSDALRDDRLSMRESVVTLGLRSLLCVPLQVKQETIGVIYVDNRFQIGIFTQDDLELLRAIAANAAIAIENARLYQVAVEKGRMERELQLAYKVQSSLLPVDIPHREGWDFAAKWQPATQVAGDFYDFIILDDDHIGLVIADVTDKGMPAALYMAFSRSILRANINHASSSAQAVTDSNRMICSESSYGFFVTLFFALLDVSSGNFTYVNGGHVPTLLVKNEEGDTVNKIQKLMPTGIALGIDAEQTYKENSILLNAGDFVVLYSDGITEAINQKEHEYGTERLENVLLAINNHSAEGVIEAIISDLISFTGGQEAFDDITIVVAMRKISDQKPK